jgi:hypothetical protein
VVAGQVDPNKPHEFRSIDALMAPMAGDTLGTGSKAGVSMAAAATMSAQAEADSCRLPGCGRPGDDPIHQ